MTLVHSYDETLYLAHSRYYSQWIGNLPFAPHVYWNVYIENDIIPVCTYGYKNLKSAQQQIKKYIADIKEYRLVHTETEDEYDNQMERIVHLMS